jgi:hypothetical protein
MGDSFLKTKSRNLDVAAVQRLPERLQRTVETGL